MEPLLLLLWVGMAVGCGLIASQRGRNGVVWAVAALVISPLLAYLGLVAIPVLPSGDRSPGGAPLPDAPSGKWLKDGDDSPVFRSPR